MPDLATHALVSLTGARLFDIFRQKGCLARSTVYLFVLGGILPDILDKTIPYAVYHFYTGDMPFRASLSFLHTPVMLLVCNYILSFLFIESYRRIAFLALSTGVSVHLILDLLQGNICGLGYMWFFPFSTIKPMVISLFSDDITTPLVPIFLVMVIAIELIYRKSYKQAYRKKDC